MSTAPNFVEASGTAPPLCTSIGIPEMSKIMGVGRDLTYDMLERNIIPNVRPGKRFIVSRHAFDAWWKSAGMPH